MKNTLLILTALITTASARIGETKTECDARYGKPTSIVKADSLIVYQKAGLIISTIILDGKVQFIGYETAKKDFIGNAEELSENIITTLLAANGEGWEEIDAISLDKQWRDAKSDKFAVYKPSTHTFGIMTKEWVAGVKRKQKEQEDENLEGL